jgi:arsenate reductase (thioredoxin)
MKPRVLFLCTGNSARSQMAEGMARTLSERKMDAFSAGTHPKGLHPMAEQVMSEAGIDISRHRSKGIGEFDGQAFDYVITVCDQANEACPVWPGTRERIHWSFDDPAAAQGSEAERLEVFRRVRDEIRQRVQLFLIVHRLSG